MTHKRETDFTVKNNALEKVQIQKAQFRILNCAFCILLPIFPQRMENTCSVNPTWAMLIAEAVGTSWKTLLEEEEKNG